MTIVVASWTTWLFVTTVDAPFILNAVPVAKTVPLGSSFNVSTRKRLLSTSRSEAWLQAESAMAMAHSKIHPIAHRRSCIARISNGACLLLGGLELQLRFAPHLDAGADIRARQLLCYLLLMDILLPPNSIW